MPKKIGSDKDECVRVVIRCRPMNGKETKDKYDRVIEMDSNRGVIAIRKPNSSEVPKEFTFDSVYDWNSKQTDLYEETFRSLVESVLNGFNGTIFAYGQTGTGKTHTMEGIRSDPEQRGVIPNSFNHIFTHISRSTQQQYLVRASYLEIYQEDIRDLLSKDQSQRLELKERPDTGVYVKDLSSFVTKNINEIDQVMSVGNQNRSVGATNMNEHSSRSHAIFIITIECSAEGGDGENHIRVGKLNLVDLAGSERQSKTGSEGQRLKEATKINLSLSALGNVISALVDGKSTHIPYRDSKLTRLLQDSLGGNAKTVMVATIGPASYNYDESLTTLRYASRAKSIKNKPRINEDPKDALLRQFQEEIARLKKIMESKGGVKPSKRGKSGRRKGGRRGEDDVDDVDGGNEGGEDNPEDIENYMKAEMDKLESEKKKIINDQTLIAGEKEELLKDLKEKKNLLDKETQAKLELANKIKAMESKLLNGGNVDMMMVTNEREMEIEEKKRQLAEKKRLEREMQQKLEQQEESNLGLQEQYSSIQQEIEIKTKKLKKYFLKYQSLNEEIQDLQETNDKERQELEQTQSELQRELKLRQLIIDSFIPNDEKEKLTNRVYYNPDEEEWKLKVITKESVKSEQEQQMAKRPVSAFGLNKAMTNYAKKGSVTLNPRFLGENILFLELDMPNRTTRDYEGPTLAPHLQQALDNALKDEEDLELDEPVARPKSGKGDKKKKR